MAIPYSRLAFGLVPWYSVLIVAGILLAIALGEKEAGRLEMPKDTVVDLALTIIPCGIVGARLYYVAMSWSQFADNPVSVLYIWQGGIAIYGGIIGGALGIWAYARRKQLSFLRLCDVICPGVLLAQAVGRWGNYFNMEAYGPVISDPRFQWFPLGVLIPSGAAYVWHMATFFYESLWNAAGFAVLWRIRKRQKKPGDLFAWYLLLYGSGRFIIEQLRQDSLYIGTLRASQYLSLALCLGAAELLLWRAFGKERAALPLVSLLLWTGRWFALKQPWLYALLLALALAAGVAGAGRRKAAPLLAVTAADGIGLLCAVWAVPFSPSFAGGVHAVLCSLTLPAAVAALRRA